MMDDVISEKDTDDDVISEKDTDDDVISSPKSHRNGNWK